MMKMKDKEFLLTLREYIETIEVQVDGEWGSCRSLDELINENHMPDIYAEVLRRIAANAS